jgi:hypothetical protein
MRWFEEKHARRLIHELGGFAGRHSELELLLGNGARMVVKVVNLKLYE